MRATAVSIFALLCGLPAARASEPDGCERRWTFPVPFYQSVAWSPDGSSLAFAAVTTSWDQGYRIYVADREGGKVVEIDTGGRPALYPVYSPDGRRIAFTARQDGNSDVYVIGADGTGIIRLTDHPASDGYPSWSPDGARIAFHSNRDGDYEIYVMNADGSDHARLTDHPADDYNPAWSPDGSRIAFDSDRDEIEGDEIWAVSPDGGGLERLVESGVFPTWSPDGEEILFTTEGLWAVGADGGEPRQLLDHAVYGAWSPDGSTIAAAMTELDEECRDHHSLVLLELAAGPEGQSRPRKLSLGNS